MPSWRAPFGAASTAALHCQPIPLSDSRLAHRPGHGPPVSKQRRSAPTPVGRDPFGCGSSDTGRDPEGCSPGRVLGGLVSLVGAHRHRRSPIGKGTDALGVPARSTTTADLRALGPLGPAARTVYDSDGLVK